MFTYLKLHFKYERKLASKIFALISLCVGSIAILGVLQKGPLTAILYKPSISFRGEYWQAGFNMAKDHFFFGVGLDSYGLYYRQYRDASAAVYPGLNVVTDASHNVVLDIFAGVGIFGLVAYLGIIFSILMFSFRYFRSLETFDPVFASLFIGWSSYQIQSIISINQIGLAVWGWLLGGCLVAYTKIKEKVVREELNTKQSKSKSQTSENLLPPSYVLLLTAGLTLGIGVSAPSLIADINFRNSLTSKTTTVDKVVKVAEAWPQDNFRMERVVVALNNQNQLGPAKILASKYALFFPDDFVAWKILYVLSENGSKEKQAYKARLKELDPLNHEWN
jgi:O-antigen ligase